MNQIAIESCRPRRRPARAYGPRANWRAGLLGIALLAAAGAAAAQDFRAGDVLIKHPYATPSRPGARNAAVYLLSLETRGSAPDRLLRASSPAAAKVELHTMSMTGDVMRMREVGEIPVTPGKPLAMKPGAGYHLMLIDLKQPLKVDDTIRLTLEFERGGKVEVSAPVHEAAESSSGHSGGHNKH
ncbi:MAG: copper chaperone PCu(A)C [Lautropia sp.]